MRLRELYNEQSIGLNFNPKIENSTLNKLGFVQIKLSIDLRDNNSYNRYYRLLKNHLHLRKVVFMVSPVFENQNSILISMIYGITEQLPWIVYFQKDRKEPDKEAEAYAYSLEKLRWSANQAARLNRSNLLVS